MKRRFFIPTMIFVLVSFFSNAQTTVTKNNRTVATKGYYSIGTNSEKLAQTATLRTVAVNTPVERKGYYSVEPNRKKLPSSQGILSERKITPVIKGYYGIGNNNQKLR